jgi:cytochrome c-type biogenesis protein CcmH/NrfF
LTRRLPLLSSRPALLLLAALAAALLAVGSVHGGRPGNAARAAQIDSLVKCPSCEDLSIAQSNAPSAVGLRHTVARLVRRGWSDARIEAWVTGRYGPGSLLVPGSAGAEAALYAVPAGAAALAAGFLGWYLFRRRPLRALVPFDGRGGGETTT